VLAQGVAGVGETVAEDHDPAEFTVARGGARENHSAH